MSYDREHESLDRTLVRQFRSNRNETIVSATKAVFHAYIQCERLRVASIYDWRIVEHPDSEVRRIEIHYDRRKDNSFSTQLFSEYRSFAFKFQFASRYLVIKQLADCFRLANDHPVKMTFNKIWFGSVIHAVYNRCEQLNWRLPEPLQIDQNSELLRRSQADRRVFSESLAEGWAQDLFPLKYRDTPAEYLATSSGEVTPFLEKELQRITSRVCLLVSGNREQSDEDMMARRTSGTRQVIRLLKDGATYDQVTLRTGKTVASVRQIASRARRDGLLES